MRRLPTRILASAVASVAIAGGLVVAAVLLTRPLMREAMLRTMINSMDVAACEASPAAWGSSWGDFSLYAYDPSGTSFNPDAPALRPEVLEQATTTRAFQRRVEPDGLTVVVVPMQPAGPCALIRVSAAEPDGGAMLLFFTILGATTVAGMHLAGLGTWWFVLLPLRNRVEVLSEAARKVGAAEFREPSEHDGALGTIAEVLSTSHHRIVDTRQALEARNQALEDHLAGIAHDLRTPLSSMQLALESIAGDAQGEQRDEARRALADVVYLSSLVDNLHQGARLRVIEGMGVGTVDLSQLLARLEGRYGVVGRHAEVEVAVNLPDDAVWAACPPAMAERAIANIIQNAVEHNQPGGHVAILLSRDEEAFELQVIDDGPGLPPEIRASLSEESFLTDAARSRGPGLGLLITAEVARRAGWTLTYETIEPRGLRVTLRGPLATPE